MYLRSHKSAKYCTVLQEHNRRLRIAIHFHEKVWRIIVELFLFVLFHESVVGWFTGEKNLFADTVVDAILPECLRALL
jgi:hypothetical protein